MTTVDHPLERTLVMAIVVAPALIDELPDELDGDVLADYQARAVWLAVCRLVERRAPIHIESVRAELEAQAGHRELTWYVRPSPAWPWALVDTAGVLAEALAHNPRALPVATWAHTLVRIAAHRRARVEQREGAAA